MCSEFALPQKRTVASRLTRQILCYLEVHPFLLSYFQELWNRKFQAAVNLYWQVTSMCKKLCVIIWKCPNVSLIITITISPISVIISRQVFNLPSVKWILLRSFITKEKLGEQMNRVWWFKNVQLKSVQSANQCNQLTSLKWILISKEFYWTLYVLLK